MVKLMSANRQYEVKETGVFIPKMQSRDKLEAGAVGYVIANIKSTAEIKIGDTLTDSRNSATEPLPGFQEVHPMVFSGIYPDQYRRFRASEAGDGQAPDQRFRLPIPGRKLRRARLRFPLRIPRPAPHGDHPGAASARVRHGHHRHLPERGLPGASRRTAR